MKKLAPLVFAAALVIGCSNGDGASRKPASEHPAVPAPDFTLKDLGGKDVSLSGLKGKVVMLDFWATWCPPCRESIPALTAIHEEYAAKGVEIVGVSMDEDFSAVAPFVKEKAIPYTILLGGQSDLSDVYRVRGIPTIYLLDRKGNLQRQWVGFDPRLPGEWRKAIDSLL